MSGGMFQREAIFCSKFKEKQKKVRIFQLWQWKLYFLAQNMSFSTYSRLNLCHQIPFEQLRLLKQNFENFPDAIFLRKTKGKKMTCDFEKFSSAHTLRQDAHILIHQMSIYLAQTGKICFKIYQFYHVEKGCYFKPLFNGRPVGLLCDYNYF